MRKADIRSNADMVLYISDCNLATVEHMAGLRSRNKREYERQIDIAQTMVDWIKKNWFVDGVTDENLESTRVLSIIKEADGDVAKYIKKYEVRGLGL